MGVLYPAADDVAELLVPFVRGHGGLDDAGAIEAALFRSLLCFGRRGRVAA